MNMDVVKKASFKLFGHSGLLLKKHSPEILTAVGVVGVVTAGVMAARATLRLEETVERIETRTETVKYDRAHGEAGAADLTRVHLVNAMDMAKLYGPSISLGVASIGCIFAAHGIMRRRNVALVAAYNVVEKSFADYRRRVIEEFGAQKDIDFRSGVYQEEVKDKKTGEKKIVHRVDPNGVSGYARFFDEGNPNWTKSPMHNQTFIRAQQNYANDRLQNQGYLLLNDVYDSLGMERSQAGSVVGWVISPDGDNFVDFGMYDPENEKAREFVNGQERSILLDFNVDGVIYNVLGDFLSE